MKYFTILSLLSAVLFSAFAPPVSAFAFNSSVQETIVITYAIPSTDNSMSNSHYSLFSYHWYTTINYYINPGNTYGFSTIAVVSTIVASANTWDKETASAVFSYRGITTKTSGKRDGYNVISWGAYHISAIAVTNIWTSGNKIIETDCRMNTYYKWSLSGESRKMDMQSIMTHEFGHWCGLEDLYSSSDYWLTMYGYGSYGETYKRTLGLGDVKGLETVHGS
jgi:hypothetical protein